MPTIPVTLTARELPTPQTNFVRFQVAFGEAGIAAGVLKATLPIGAFITKVSAEIITAFNAATTNVLTVGVNQGTSEIIASGDVTATAAAVTAVTRALGRGQTQTASSAVSGVAQTEGGVGLYAKFAQTGTAATAGLAEIVVEYAPANK